MTILGAIVRTHPENVAAVADRLQVLAGVDVALNPGDGRLVVVIEDGLPDAEPAHTEHPVTAAGQLAGVATWPEVLGTSLVYEYSGPDAPPPGGLEQVDFRSWREGLASVRAKSGLGTPSPSHPSPDHGAPDARQPS